MTELKYQIQKTSNGYMVIDVPNDVYLEDENGNNCFDSLDEAQMLVVKANKGEIK